MAEDGLGVPPHPQNLLPPPPAPIPMGSSSNIHSSGMSQSQSSNVKPGSTSSPLVSRAVNE